MEEDYYSAVYSWFDKCGIISNIRTHLRRNLVNALKNRDLTLNPENAEPKSAKQYIYDLLIAEYLWNHNYSYTLSVFASEAPLLVNFQKHTEVKSDEGVSRQKLRTDYIWHTLEALGIKPQEPSGLYITTKYAQSDIPLLLCIFQCLGSMENVQSKKKQYHESKEKEMYSKSQEVQTDIANANVVQEAIKLSEAKKRLLRQKELFDSQLSQKENELKEHATVVERQLALLQEKLEEAQSFMQTFCTKERQFSEEKKQEEQRLLQKETELSIREKLLSQEATRLEKERDSYRQFEGDLKKLQEELSKVKRDFPPTNQNTNNNFRDIKIQTDFESYTFARNERANLCHENQELKSLVEDQKLRIKQLSERSLQLSRQLEELQLFRPVNTDMSIAVGTKYTNGITVSESSSTDEILQDAKMRVRRLEEKSVRANESYFNYISTTSL